MRNNEQLYRHLERTKTCGNRFILTKHEIKADLFGEKMQPMITPLPLFCNSYFCSHCSKKKKNILFMKAKQGMQNESWRMLTLTTKNTGDNLQLNFFLFAKAWNKLATFLRKRHQDLKYFKVMEIGKNGMLHAHILINIYVQKEIIKKLWKKYTGAYIIDIRRVTGNKKSLNYILKYFEKSLEEFETNKYFYQFQKRHFSFSRNWKKQEKKKEKFRLISERVFTAQALHDILLQLGELMQIARDGIDLDYLPPPYNLAFQCLI